MGRDIPYYCKTPPTEKSSNTLLCRFATCLQCILDTSFEHNLDFHLWVHGYPRIRIYMMWAKKRNIRTTIRAMVTSSNIGAA